MPMHSNAILHEVQQLYKVSDRLDSLAEQHPLVSEALITYRGKRSQYRHCVGGASCDKNASPRRTRPSKCLTY